MNCVKQKILFFHELLFFLGRSLFISLGCIFLKTLSLFFIKTPFIKTKPSNEQKLMTGRLQNNEVIKINYFHLKTRAILSIVCKIPLLARRTRPKGR